jgi:hypothetical protein
MAAHTEDLGGRLPLLNPLALSAQQRDLYDRINATFGKWSDSIHFQIETDNGSLIGPLNPILYSPGISSSFLGRQVVILATGSVWRSDYELYAHSAAARKAGISENAIRRPSVVAARPEQLRTAQRGRQALLPSADRSHQGRLGSGPGRIRPGRLLPG